MNEITDTDRMNWIISHATNLECSEMVAGNFEKFIVPATRESIDQEVNATPTESKP